MTGGNAELVETRTHELSEKLFDLVREYNPSTSERIQDWLMEQMAREPVFKARFLRFVDVLPALDADERRSYLKRLFREYFAEDFPQLSTPLKNLVALCRQPAAPAWLVSGITERAVEMLADRFIAGDDEAAILRILSYLERQRRYSTIALLGEDVLSEHEAELYKTRYLRLIDSLSGHFDSSHRSPLLQLSIKLTSLTDNFNPADGEGTLRRVRSRLEEIARHCASNSIELHIDAELFEHRELTWHIFSEIFGPGSAFSNWSGIGMTVQSYFKDSEEYLETVLEFARKRQAPFGLRLAKGAYWDYEVITARQNHWPVPVFEQKVDTDRTFRNMLHTLLKNSRFLKLGVAGHNIADHARAEAVRETLGLPEGSVEHQVLFRTAEGVSRALRSMGWPTRDYVPSGQLVPGMAYLMRRVQENTSPLGFLMRSRSGESVTELLRPAPETPLAEQKEAGFQNYPPKRLFISNERTSFESALKTGYTQWGREYHIELGDKTVATHELKPSLSPSRPDPQNPVGRTYMAGVAEAQQATAIARQGFQRWAQTPVAERARILLRAAGRLAEERDALAIWIVYEGGRTWAEALADVDEAVDHFAFNAHRLLDSQQQVQEQYQPRGIVAVIPPWNFPVALPAGMISGALAAGNAVLFKSAEQTPVIGARLAEVLHSAGVPRDVLLHLPGWGEVAGEHLVDSPEVDMVAFTGSKAVGISINKKASAVRLGSGLKKVVAEMGGKNAIVVFPDADLDEAVKGIVLSAFEHCNQKCSACSRVFVHRSVFKRLSERLVHAVSSLPVGPGDDPGTLVNPLIGPDARERVLAYAEKARHEGKVLVDRILTGSPNPLQVGPLVVELALAGLATSTIAREEIFGPVLFVTPFEDENEMLAQVNGTVYALTAGVFSRSPETVSRMIQGIRAGNIYINRKITGARVGIEPFGGFQLSGTGPKAGSREYLFAFLTRQLKPEASHPATASAPPVTMPELANVVSPWTLDAVSRREVLRRCVRLLESEFRSQLTRALEKAGKTPDEAARTVGGLVGVAAGVIESAAEIAEPEPTLAIPGQKNFIDWQTPRGVGFVATDDSAPAERFVGMVFGPLLAGNGLVLAPSIALQPVASVLVDALQSAGVPRQSLVIAPHGGPDAAVLLADDLFHFAVTDMGPEATFRVCERLGETREEKGQCWVKALFSMQEGHRPGEPGFVRQFALPKAVSIRTLRHGADLDIPLRPS
ncbi:MAG: proline dehydrogenase family protein [Chloroflexi bacterium]|nr:proline dehydrogenase family protein [Chloroflexota bacterium]